MVLTSCWFGCIVGVCAAVASATCEHLSEPTPAHLQPLTPYNVANGLRMEMGTGRGFDMAIAKQLLPFTEDKK